MTVGYATSNRSAVIRIPAYAKSPETKRFGVAHVLGSRDVVAALVGHLIAIVTGGVQAVVPVRLPGVCTIGQDGNRPFDQYPKNVSLRAVEYMKESGIADRMVIGPEFEFYLFDSARFEVSRSWSRRSRCRR